MQWLWWHFAKWLLQALEAWFCQSPIDQRKNIWWDTVKSDFEEKSFQNNSCTMTDYRNLYYMPCHLLYKFIKINRYTISVNFQSTYLKYSCHQNQIQSAFSLSKCHCVWICKLLAKRPQLKINMYVRNHKDG